MRSRTLITTGTVSVGLAAICCATPLLAVLFGAIGLAAWIAKADYVVIAMLILGVVLIGFGIYRRQAGAGLHSDTLHDP